MKLIEAIENLQKSKTFKAWHKKHPESFLAHCFVMLDEMNKHIWQIGYYNKDKDSITTFVVEPEKIDMVEDAAIFREPQSTIQPIKTDKIKFDIDKIMEIVDSAQKEKFKGHEPQKVMMILQNLEDCGQIFNVTVLTKTLKTINFKVDAENGKLVKCEMVDLFSFSAK